MLCRMAWYDVSQLATTEQSSRQTRLLRVTWIISRICGTWWVYAFALMLGRRSLVDAVEAENDLQRHRRAVQTYYRTNGWDENVTGNHFPTSLRQNPPVAATGVVSTTAIATPYICRDFSRCLYWSVNPSTLCLKTCMILFTIVASYQGKSDYLVYRAVFAELHLGFYSINVVMKLKVFVEKTKQICLWPGTTY